MVSSSPASASVNERHFTWLLWALVGLLLCDAVTVDISPLLSRALNLTFFLAIVATATLIVTPRARALALMAMGSALSGLAYIGYFVTGSEQVLAMSHVCLIGTLTYSAISIGGYLMRCTRVSRATINAALCVYLLMAVLWAAAYSLVEILDPSAFALSDRLVESGATMRFVGEESTAMYYSVVTLTTLGYGDISPISNPARILAGMQAIFGQFYLVITVARLVGIFAATPADESQEE